MAKFGLMQKLDEYLQRKRIAKGKFAERAGIPAYKLSRLLTGKRKADIATALRIEKATGGEITVRDWVSKADLAEVPTQ